MPRVRRTNNYKLLFNYEDGVWTTLEIRWRDALEDAQGNAMEQERVAVIRISTLDTPTKQSLAAALPGIRAALDAQEPL